MPTNTFATTLRSAAMPRAKPGLIPFLDLRHSIEELRHDLDAAYERVLTSGQFILGRELEAFESEFAAACGVSHAIGVGSGTDALTLILKAMDIGPADEVIVPAHTCIATWLGVTAAGAELVPIEPDAATYLIDPTLVEAAITSRTAAILPVHLYGHCADMTSLLAIGEKYDLPVIVDAAQAVGVSFSGKRKSAIGHAGAFSFYPTKNIGALGDGGAVVTDDATLAAKVRSLRNYGAIEKDRHELQGANSRLDELQAAFLRCQLGRLDEWNSRRARLAHEYRIRLAGLPQIILPRAEAPTQHVWHLFTIRVGQGHRNDLKFFLEQADIDTRIYYPVPPHLSGAYRNDIFPRPPLAITEDLAASVLSLPLHPHLDVGDVARICGLVQTWASAK
jgi:dTDP-3-amino-3,4,6-trideoxy-alpha-D-glucose transaminase